MLIFAPLYYDTYLTNEPDEAFRLYNPLAPPVPLAGWQVTVRHPHGDVPARHDARRATPSCGVLARRPTSR